MTELTAETVASMLEDSGHFSNVSPHDWFVGATPSNTDEWLEVHTDVITVLARQGWIVSDVSGRGRLSFERLSHIQD